MSKPRHWTDIMILVFQLVYLCQISFQRQRFISIADYQNLQLNKSVFSIYVFIHLFACEERHWKHILPNFLEKYFLARFFDHNYKTPASHSEHKEKKFTIHLGVLCVEKRDSLTSVFQLTFSTVFQFSCTLVTWSFIWKNVHCTTSRVFKNEKKDARFAPVVSTCVNERDCHLIVSHHRLWRTCNTGLDSEITNTLAAVGSAFLCHRSCLPVPGPALLDIKRI